MSQTVCAAAEHVRCTARGTKLSALNSCLQLGQHGIFNFHWQWKPWLLLVACVELQLQRAGLHSSAQHVHDGTDSWPLA